MLGSKWGSIGILGNFRIRLRINLIVLGVVRSRFIVFVWVIFVIFVLLIYKNEKAVK